MVKFSDINIKIEGYITTEVEQSNVLNNLFHFKAWQMQLFPIMVGSAIVHIV